MVTKVPVFVVHKMEVRMRIGYAVSKKHFLDFDSTLISQKFNQEEAKKSIWEPSTIPNQRPVEKKNCPYSYLVTRTCGTDTHAQWVYCTKINVALMMITKFHVVATRNCARLCVALKVVLVAF